ncbi:MAG: sensor histidine kinase [Candidatus Dormibacteria bacterium]
MAAGAIEYNLLQGAVLNSRGQSLQAAFRDGRAVLVAEQRSRRRGGLPPLPATTLSRDLVRLLAAAGFSSAVYGPQLSILDSAAPHPQAASGIRLGARLPAPSRSDLVAAVQYDTVIGPTVLGQGASARLVMLLPLTGRLGSNLGAAELSQPYGPIRAELSAAVRVVALGSLGVLLLALLVGLWLTARGLGPLRRLTNTAQALGRGDLSQRSGLRPRRDEVGELARVFDEMAESVEGTVRERESSERRMRQFIADASHELRTPLTAIKGYLDVLQRGEGPPPELTRAALPVMSQETERMRRLVMDLLTLARADEGQALHARAVELNAFLAKFLASHRSTAPVTLGPGPRAVARADPDALSAIVSNLQTNAERHGRGAPIHWSTVTDGERVGVRCEDGGPGIAAADLPHVFERFYRPETSRSRRDGGSGLGLAIVQSLVEAQAGRVWAESTPGQGCVFTVLLPHDPGGDPTSAA